MEPFGFAKGELSSFYIGNRRYCVSCSDTEVLTLLQQIYEARLAADNRYWAVRMRPQIRRIELLNARAVIVHVIEKTPDVRMRILAIWLRGRCGGYLGTATIASFAHAPEYQLQKECVRALQRLSGWAELREIASNAGHPRIRKLATQPAVKPLGERLSCMLKNVQPISTSEESSPKSKLWLLSGHVLNYTAPKSVEAIRQILWRIKRLVSS